MVDVNIAVYNHASFLRQTLDSVLMQRTVFPVRLVIGDDCSTDGSVEILLDYKKKFPDRIMLTLQQKNLGLQNEERNGIVILKKSTAKYIALLDGDDYWTDPHKLQKQIDILESNPDVAISYHRVNELQQNGEISIETLNTSDQVAIYTVDDLARGNIIHTPTVVFRNTILSNLPHWFGKAPMGDYVIHMLTARTGKIHYMPDVMAVYRAGIGAHGASQIEKRLANWKLTLEYLITMNWSGHVKNTLISRRKIIEHIIRRHKFKTLYKIRDGFVQFTGLRLLKRILTR